MTTEKNSLSELPKGWVWTRLSEVVDIRNGFAFKSSDYRDSGVLLVRQSNLGHSKVNIDNAAYLPEAYLGKYPEFTVTKGDVLIGMSGSIGKLCLCNLDTVALQNQRTGLLEFFEPDMKPYVWYYLNTLERSLTTMARGVGVQNISAAQIKSYPITIPPLPEQHRIVTKIEELFTRLDAGVEALKKIKSQLKRYRQSVIKHAFEGKLTEEWRQTHKDDLEPASVLLERIKQERQKIAKGKYKELPPLDTSDFPELPESWCWTSIGTLLDVSIGGTPSRQKPEYWNGHVNWVSSGEVANCHIDKTRECITELGLQNSTAKLLPPGTVLLAMIGEGKTRGQVALLNIAATTNQNIASIHCANSAISGNYIFLWLLSRYKETRAKGSGDMQPALNSQRVRCLAIPLCPLVEQHELVAEIERRFSVAGQIEKTIDHSLKQAERLRQSILKRAFAGKLVPQDPNEERAEKLLERIKEERAKRLAEDHSRKKNRTRVTTKQTRLV